MQIQDLVYCSDGSKSHPAIFHARCDSSINVELLPRNVELLARNVAVAVQSRGPRFVAQRKPRWTGEAAHRRRGYLLGSEERKFVGFADSTFGSSQNLSRGMCQPCYGVRVGFSELTRDRGMECRSIRSLTPKMAQW